MSLKSNFIPDNIARCMDRKDRRGALTFAEADEKRQRYYEREMHQQFINWLNLNKLPFGHSVMYKKSSYTEGWPDFCVFWNERSAFIEFKAEGGQLSYEQQTCIYHLRQAGASVLVTTSVAEAIKFTKDTLKIL